MIWRWLLSPYYGPINAVLGFAGLQGPGWLYDTVWAMPGIVLASVWKDMGFYGLIFLAGLQSISVGYYEAAEIDGATRWQRFRKVTLPLLSPTLFFVMIISIINSFQLFPQVMIMTQGGPHGSTQVMVERIYNYAFTYYKMGYATALSWVLFAIIFVVTFFQLRMQKRWVHYD
jgi:multiple sugar transport system permease protein